MKRNYFFLAFAVLFIAGKSMAQTIWPCYTDEMYKKYKANDPQIEINEKQLEKSVADYYTRNKAFDKFSRKTGSADSFYYDIPVVVHVIHNYGTELLDDNKIYNLLAEMNNFYSLKNNISMVEPEFKPYIGKAYIRFHLATKDPFGQPTKGITHRVSYLTYGGDDQAKFDQWPPASYLNIWFDARIGAKPKTGIIVAYTELPPAAAAEPWYDGIISNGQFINDGNSSSATASGGSIDHEVGHYFYLYHTFGHTNNPGTNTSGACTDDDGVDDTPPTDGNLGGCHLYDTICSANYFKIYTNISGGDSLVNYPDTANEQNIMNYADCKLMFTKGQIERIHASLNSDVAKRDSVWSAHNLALTGAMDTIDLAPVNDFVMQYPIGTNCSFICAGTGSTASNAVFIAKPWNDTITSFTWNFKNCGASNESPAAVAQTPSQVTSGSNAAGNVISSFATGGWLDFTLSSTGNHTGTTTTEYTRSIFVADPVGTQAQGYYMEFTSPDTAKWPTFNYYNNEFYWQIANVGFDDNASMQYVGFDQRIAPVTGSPLGDFDDFFSMPMDFTSFGTGPCNLNFYYSGASRSSNSFDINDRLDIQYSIDRGKTWKELDSLTKGQLENKGNVYYYYIPSSRSDWAPMTIPIPDSIRTNYTLFRFRYSPGVILNQFTGIYDVADGSVTSSGNNFYIDRINFSAIPATVSNTMKDNMDVAVAPNPTTGDAYVIIKDADYATATVIVTDITGKEVYSAEHQINGTEANIVIPHSAIAVKGVYLVQTVTGNQVKTEKLVVY